MRWLGKERARFLRGQRGFTLIETLIALGILAFIGAAYLSALHTGFRSYDITREHVMAENLVRAQLEDIHYQPYQDSYVVTVPLPREYSITIDTQPYCWPEPCTPDGNIQKNTVTVSRGGKSLLTVADLKTRR